MSDAQKTTDDDTCTGCQGSGWNSMTERTCDCQPSALLLRAPMRPETWYALCPACDRPHAIDGCEWEERPDGSLAAVDDARFPVCEYCKTQFEVVAVQMAPVGEFSPAQKDDALAAELAADPAIAASLAEWERTSGPPPGEYSLRPWLADAMLSLAQSNVPTDVQAMLAYGDGRGGVAPGALAKAVNAAVKVALSDAAYAVLLVHNDRIARGRAGFTSHAMAECQDAIKGVANG